MELGKRGRWRRDKEELSGKWRVHGNVRKME